MKIIIKYLVGVAILSGISLVVYYFIRILFFLSSDYGTVDRIFAVLLLAGETYMTVHAFGYVLTVFRLGSGKDIYKFPKKSLQEFPSVAVAVVARHEPKEVLEQTFITLTGLEYPNHSLYLLDGSDEEQFIADDRELCRKYGINYFHPEKLAKTKGGTINQFLKVSKEKYVALFDADQNPMPDFLQKVVAIAESDEKIAFVQTPQYYSNFDVSPIAKGASMQQAIFFEGTCDAKGMTNSMFFCGTNALLRRDVLLEVGGIDEESITEDFSTSVLLHLKGYRSVYYNHVRAFGMAPESLPAYFRQQARWAAGCAGVFRNVLKYLIISPQKMSLAQWSEYLLSGSYYFVGWSFFLLSICPIAFLIFRIPSYFLDPRIYLAAFLPYFFMTFLTFYATMKKRHYDSSGIYNGVIMGSLSFPVYMLATLKGLLGLRLKFQITPKGKKDKLSFWQLIPWLIMIVLNIVALIFGLFSLAGDFYATLINMVWCGYHLFILLHIFRLNTVPDIREKEYLKRFHAMKEENGKILALIDESIRYEELAIPIYNSHLKSTVFLSGLKEDKQEKIIESLNILTRESEGHIVLLKKVKEMFMNKNS